MATCSACGATHPDHDDFCPACGSSAAPAPPTVEIETSTPWGKGASSSPTPPPPPQGATRAAPPPPPVAPTAVAQVGAHPLGTPPPAGQVPGTPPPGGQLPGTPPPGAPPPGVLPPPPRPSGAPRSGGALGGVPTAAIAVLVACVVVVAGVAVWKLLADDGNEDVSTDSTPSTAAVTAPATAPTLPSTASGPAPTSVLDSAPVTSGSSLPTAPSTGPPAPTASAPAATAPPPSGPGPVAALPSGLFCRDLASRGYSYTAAVEYWRLHGFTDQMDADRNGIPCETVYPRADVTSYWGADSVAPPPGIASLPSGLFCRDLIDRELGYPDAVAYWFSEGQPDRMDEDLDGIPCETGYSTAEVDAYWG